MSEDQPTNGELAQMIKGLREVVELRFDENGRDHNATNKHLKKLNGQVVKNTLYITEENAKKEQKAVIDDSLYQRAKNHWIAIVAVINGTFAILVTLIK